MHLTKFPTENIAAAAAPPPPPPPPNPPPGRPPAASTHPTHYCTPLKHDRPARYHLLQIRQQQASWRQQYERFCKAVQPGVGCSFAWEEDFLWAMENVRSRAFSGPYTGSSGEQGSAGGSREQGQCAVPRWRFFCLR